MGRITSNNSQYRIGPECPSGGRSAERIDVEGRGISYRGASPTDIVSMLTLPETIAGILLHLGNNIGIVRLFRVRFHGCMSPIQQTLRFPLFRLGHSKLHSGFWSPARIMFSRTHFLSLYVHRMRAHPGVACEMSLWCLASSYSQHSVMGAVDIFALQRVIFFT